MSLGICLNQSARLVQYRARKQAADLLGGRLLTRAVLYRCPNSENLQLDLQSNTLHEFITVTQSSVSILRRWNMYCPNCGAQAADETKYCRACGQSLTLISQAMMKSLPVDDNDRQKLEKAIKNISLGVGFLIVSIVAGILFGEPINWFICFSTLIAAMVWLSLGVAGILGRAISGSLPVSSVDR